MKTPFLVLLACLLGAGFYAIFYVIAADRDSDQTWTFVGHEIEPFFYKSGSQGIQGALYELTQEICKLQKKHCKFKIAAFRNLQDMVVEGKADIGGPLAFTHHRTLLFYYSVPLFATEYCFFTSPKNYKENFSLDDLRDRTVRVFGPSATELSLQRLKEVLNQRLKIIMELDNHTALRLSENNTHEFSYANCHSGRYWIEKNRSPLREISSLGEQTEYHLILSKKTFSPRDLRDFNQTIMDLRKKGFLQELADKYKLTLAEFGK